MRRRRTTQWCADSTWGICPDHLLNDAILQLNLSLLPATLPLNVQTDSIANPYNPYAANAPLKIYADGVRNAYDLVFASNGHLYAPVNGSSAGGNTPASPNGTRSYRPRPHRARLP